VNEREETFRTVGLPASVMSTLNTPAERRKYPELHRFRSWVEGFRTYLIWDPKVLRDPCRGKHDELGPSGEHLATVVGRLKEKDPRSFSRLVRRLKRIFPHLTDITVSGRGWGWRTITLHEGDSTFNSRQMSDGVLRLLAVATMLYLDRVPTVLTFEEPENGVHPQLIREVVQVLRELTQRKPPNQCQVFFTTHSPYVLDEFFDYPENVYCLDRRQPEAGTAVVRLSENKKLKLARDAFKQSLGEAWTSGVIGATAGVRTS
jgi:predicted ATPase